jgi:hypothetical protein
MAEAESLVWESRIIWEYPGSLSCVISGDCDNDGCDELIVIIESDGSGLEMLKKHDGYWISSRIWNGIPYFRGVAIGDVDLNHAGNEVIIKNWTAKYGIPYYWYSNITMLSYNGAFWEETVLWGSLDNQESLPSGSIAIGDVDPIHIGDEIVLIHGSKVIMLEKIGSSWVSALLWEDIAELESVVISDIDPAHAGNEIIVAGYSGKITKIFKDRDSWTAHTIVTHSSPITRIAVPIDPAGPSWMLIGDQSGNVIRVDLLSLHTSVIFTAYTMIYDIEIGKALPRSDLLTYKGFVLNRRDLIMIDGNEVFIVWSYKGQDWWNDLTDVVVGDFDDGHYGLEVAVVGEMGKAVYLIARAEYEDQTPPTTLDDYDGLWHCTDFTITLTAKDDLSGVKETFYKINNGPVMSVESNGHPRFTAEGANNTLEYWSVDNADNEEFPHKILTGIKLDKTSPFIIEVKHQPEGDVDPGQSVKVLVDVTDSLSGIGNIILSYNIDNGPTWTEITMTLNTTTGFYEAPIQGQPPDTKVKYKVVAYDNAGNVKVEDNDGEYYVYTVIPEFQNAPILILLILTTMITTKLLKTKRKHQTP